MANAWIPPLFPTDGRLGLSVDQITENYNKREYEKQLAKNRHSHQHSPNPDDHCCKTLHMSFFFDGTNNNKRIDTQGSMGAIIGPPTPIRTLSGHMTNIAKLFEACYDDVLDKNKNQVEPKLREYFKTYCQGVGSTFAEIEEYEYSGMGLAFAKGGGNRLGWALVSLVENIFISLDLPKLDLYQKRKYVKEVSPPLLWPITKGTARRRAFFKKLDTDYKLRQQLTDASTKPKPLAIKLFVYGFSRGAAEARTFLHWIAELLDYDTDAPLAIRQEPTLFGVPISIEFVGVVDTVATVGIGHTAPVFQGHMAWANGTQTPPCARHYPNLIKSLYHFVAATEQRNSFPVDSVRNPEQNPCELCQKELEENPNLAIAFNSKTYNSNVFEVLYPGVHSDVGGGYSPGDQGKARLGEVDVLSQIALHDLYSLAFAHGAPLTVENPKTKPINIKPTLFFEMPQADVSSRFRLATETVNRFNLWHRHTFTNPAGNAPLVAAPAATNLYSPLQAPVSIDQLVQQQMAWMTAWRISRYAKMSLKNELFIKDIKDEDSTDFETRAKATDSNIKTARSEKKIHREAKTEEQFIPVISAPAPAERLMHATQLNEAAIEFAADYHGTPRPQNPDAVYSNLIDYLLPAEVFYLINSDDEKKELEQMKKDAQGSIDKVDSNSRVMKLFADYEKGTITTDPEVAELCRLFDDQIHDSRAWFMHDQLKGREPWAGYFHYRMIYFGSDENKNLDFLSYMGRLFGLFGLVGALLYAIKRGKLSIVAQMFSRMTALHQFINLIRTDPPQNYSTFPDAIKSLAALYQHGTSLTTLAGKVAKQSRKDFSKNVVKDVGKILGIPKPVIDVIVGRMP